MSDGGRPQPLPYSRGCFVCGRDNPHGLGLRFERRGEWVETECLLAPHYNGFVERTHGGIIAALLDEAMGWATVLSGGRFTYTVELTLRYKRPVPVGEPVRVRARVVRENRRLASAEGEILSGDEQLVQASGKFMHTSAEETRRIADALIYESGSWRIDQPD